MQVFNTMQYLWQRTKLALGLAMSALLLAPVTSNAANVPHVTPNTNFEGSDKAGIALNVLAGIGVFVMVAVFLLSLISLGSSLRNGDKDKGVKGPALGLAGSLIVLVLLFSFNTFLNGWLNVFGA